MSGETVHRSQRLIWLLLAICSLVTATCIAVLAVARREIIDRKSPPVLLSLSDFSLTERSGRVLSLGDLRGKVCVFDFIFTRCMGPCPAMTKQMDELRKTFQRWPQGDQIRLVSVTVDPEYDTPEVLRRYATSTLAQADSEDWLFLTGEKMRIYALINAFKLPVGELSVNDFFHSTKFVLVDQRGRIRGFYDGLEAHEREALIRDAQVVLAEGGG